MAEKIAFNGNHFEILEGKKLRITNLGSATGEFYIPKFAMVNGERYEVVSVGNASSNSNNIFSKHVRLSPNITTIVFPDSIERMDGEGAFRDLSNLKKVKFSDILKNISGGAFSECGIEELDIPDSVTEIGGSAFYDCKNLKTVKIGRGVTKIGGFAFSRCSSFSVTIPDSVTEIGRYAFYSCKNLKTVKIGKGITVIGENAFSGCESLTTVDIYNDPFEVSVGPNAFPPNAKVNYLGKKAAPKDTAKTEKPKEEKPKATPAANIDLDKLMEAVIADGVITDKERSVIIKKATDAGYDADEVEILLDGKLAEKLSQNTPKPEVSKPEAKKEQKIETTEEDADYDVYEAMSETNEEDELSDIPWDKILWTPLNEKLSKVLKIRLPKPALRGYICYKVKSMNAKVCTSYSVSDGFARVSIETYSGEEAKAIIDNMLAQLPEDNPFKNAEISQGKKNKDKWAWTVLVSMDKNDSQLVQWYADNVINAYKAFGEI